MGHILRVVTNYNLLENITRLIFTHTSTIGIKYYELKSFCMNKKFKEVSTSNYEKIKL